MFYDKWSYESLRYSTTTCLIKWINVHTKITVVHIARF